MPRLELLLSHADDHRPVAPRGLPAELAAEGNRPEAPAPPLCLWQPNGRPDDLRLQRWGVVAPAGARGDRLLELIQPLYAARQKEQGGAPPRIYRVSPASSVGHTFGWREPEVEQPRYLLLLGDFNEVSLALQRALGLRAFVGRLAFHSDAGFDAYVRKVLRYERELARPAKARALFYTVHDGTAATLIGHPSLLAPCLHLCRALEDLGKLPARELIEIGDPIDWSPKRLLAVAGMPAPSLLFTVGHGVGTPRAGWRSLREQQRLQGTLSFGSQGHLKPAALERGAFLPGGIWLNVASFGAGTPTLSAFHRWLALRVADHAQERLEPILAALPRPNERPFVSAIAQAALANPEGPLAVLGHADLAWTYCFREEAGARGRSACFASAIQALISGQRAGAGLHALLRCAADSPGDARAAPLSPHRWMLLQELASYVLLGDPAARLPLVPAPVARSAR